MKVAYDTRAARHRTGVARYARGLAAALAAHPDIELIDTHQPRRGRCDVYHSPWIDGAVLRPPVPAVVTLHDLIPLKRPGEYLRTGMRFRLRYLAVERATRLIVPTRVVAEDAARMLNLDPERITVVGEAVDPVFSPRPADEVAAVRRRLGLPDRYLLWVGGLETPDPRKRVAALARTERTLPLVLVGPTTRWAHELPDVHLTGAVEDDVLAAIYTGAHAVVFPSDDEGFGLVPVEALACGTPVAVADVPALREVLGDRAIYAPVDDLSGLVSAAEAAHGPAPDPLATTWADVADATAAVYAAALAER